MKPERWQQLDQLLDAALERPPAERAAFLAEVCAGDETLHQQMEALLRSDEAVENFIEAPAVAWAAELLTENRAKPLIGERLGHYKILARLGAGGMGEVYLAQDLHLERQVALKVLPVESTANPDSLRRFTQEAKAASALNHPNIITIHEIGQVDGLHFIATEFVEGQTLRHQLAQGKLSLQEALEIATQTAHALQAAHAAGITHRDIKPENLMLRPDGYVKVLDFGLAKLIEKHTSQAGLDSQASAASIQETAPGMVLGTVAYMSPEQARGERVDGRSDLWSLGVMLYEMLAGQRPFNGSSIAESFAAILGQPPAPLAALRPGIPAELEQLVMKLLAKEREQRYASAAELAAELKQFAQRLGSETQLSDPAELPTLSFKAQPTDEQIGQRKSQPIEAPATAERATPLASAVEPKTAPVKPAPTSRPAHMAVALLLLALLGFVAWWMLRPRARETAALPATAADAQLPERAFSYWLDVQKMRDGKPYQSPYPSAGQHIFESGYKFRLNFSSPQSGYLYLLNEGPTEGGAISYALVFPIPTLNNGSAQIAGDQTSQTGWYQFTEHEGTEKFWLVWAAQAVEALEAVKSLVNAVDQGQIRAPNQLNPVRALLGAHAQLRPEVTPDKVKEQTHVRGRGATLIHLVELKHR
jgi:serine/threonine protein kinase